MTEPEPREITKPSLERKPLEEWSPAERAAAREMSHTVSINYLAVRELARRGTKYHTYGDIVEELLEISQAPATQEAAA